MCMSSVASGTCAQAGSRVWRVLVRRIVGPGWLYFMGGSFTGLVFYVLSEISLSSPDLEHIGLSHVLGILVPIYF